MLWTLLQLDNRSYTKPILMYVMTINKTLWNYYNLLVQFIMASWVIVIAFEPKENTSKTTSLISVSA
jgi:hypothetical protein